MGDGRGVRSEGGGDRGWPVGLVGRVRGPAVHACFALRINATISAANFFGARNGLESLSQLIIFDDLRNEVQMARDVYVVDSPVYPHRGILLDTSRNYVPIDVIKRTIEGMAISKLNTFHWHITDSHSFPFVSKSQPELSRLGAYSPSQVRGIHRV